MNRQLYNNFNSNRCNICFLDDTTNVCSETKVACQSCKLIKYCNIEHQIKDWDIHKPFCDAIVGMMEATSATHILGCAQKLLQDKCVDQPREKRELQRKIDCSIFATERLLGRRLMQHEFVLLKYPFVCNVCHNVDSTKLKLCRQCNQIAYCSKEHQEQDRPKHSKWCNAYRLNFILGNNAPKIKILSKIVKMDKTRSKQLPRDNYELASTTLGREIRKPCTNGPVMVQQEEIENLKIASTMSWMGTILHILNVTNMLNELRDSLSIFVLGASKETLFFNPTTCAALFSCIPTLRRVRIYQIGPDVMTKNYFYIEYDEGQKLEIFHFPYVYHKLPQNIKLDHPQLIVAFNSGFNEECDLSSNSWLPTIQAVLHFRNVPFAFTSYTNAEAIDDCAVVLRESKKLDVKCMLTFVKRAAVNPFRDLHPFRNPDLLDEKDELYYDNGYLSIVLAKQQTEGRDTLDLK